MTSLSSMWAGVKHWEEQRRTFLALLAHQLEAGSMEFVEAELLPNTPLVFMTLHIAKLVKLIYSL
jgi:hypothetical protein